MFPLLVIIAGVTGTIFMSIVMYFIHRQGWANADMIRAIGSLITRKYENSVAPGLLLHLVAGCIFAIPYIFVMREAGVNHWLHLVSVGLALGTFHGAAMIFILMALAEKHPIPQFQKASIDVAWSHVLGHMAYGTGVGIAVALLGPRIGGFTVS
jgi:hypothetical protein